MLTRLGTLGHYSTCCLFFAALRRSPVEFVRLLGYGGRRYVLRRRAFSVAAVELLPSCY